MYRLVIIEDEHDVRKRIAGMVERSGCGFLIAAEYENGIDAYDGITADPPDLIITDIKIPYIGGIELAKRIREVQPLVKIIVVTGFDEFDYAKEAANLGVIGFVSKPVTEEDIAGVLRKAAETLDKEFIAAENLSRLRAFYNNGLPMLRETLLFRLSNMSSLSAGFEETLRHSDISLDYRWFVVCLFDFDGTADAEGDERYETAVSSIRMLAEDGFSARHAFELFNRYEKLCLILKSDDPFSRAETENVLSQIILRVGRYSGMPLSVGVSGLCDSRNFSKMVREAQRALEYRAVVGGEKVFFFESGVGTGGDLRVIEDNDIKELGYLLRYRPLPEAVGVLGAIRERLTGDDARGAYYYVLTAILNVLIKSCDSLDGLYREFNGLDAMYRRLFESKTPDESFQFLESVARAVRRRNDGLIVDHVERNLRRILNYIDTHYADPDISIVSLSNDASLSVSYVSALFKKNLNTTFVKYLTALRMERAKELLQNPNLKIIDIAEQLGYADPYYFSHCFKKYTGQSPKEYRNNE